MEHRRHSITDKTQTERTGAYKDRLTRELRRHTWDQIKQSDWGETGSQGAHTQQNSPGAGVLAPWNNRGGGGGTGGNQGGGSGGGRTPGRGPADRDQGGDEGGRSQGRDRRDPEQEAHSWTQNFRGAGTGGHFRGAGTGESEAPSGLDNGIKEGWTEPAGTMERGEGAVRSPEQHPSLSDPAPCLAVPDLLTAHPQPRCRGWSSTLRSHRPRLAPSWWALSPALGSGSLPRGDGGLGSGSGVDLARSSSGETVRGDPFLARVHSTKAAKSSRGPSSDDSTLHAVFRLVS